MTIKGVLVHTVAELKSFAWKLIVSFYLFFGREQRYFPWVTILHLVYLFESNVCIDIMNVYQVPCHPIMNSYMVKIIGFCNNYFRSYM